MKDRDYFLKFILHYWKSFQNNSDVQARNFKKNKIFNMIKTIKIKSDSQ